MPSFSTALSDLGAVAGLFSGPYMSLGSFTFGGFEIPDKINWGGKQRTVMHQYPGGGRVIDVMGRDDKEITWSGLLLGPQAAGRAQQLDKIRIAGQAVVLTWGSVRVTVVVSSIDFEEKYHQIGYSVTCLPTQVPLAATASSSLLGSLTNDLGNALGINIPAALDTVQAAITKVQPLVNVAATLTGGSPAALRILGAVNTASSVTASLGSIANDTLGSFGASTSPFSAFNPVAAIRTLTSLGSSVSIASATAAIGPYLSRMASNLTNPGAA